MSDIYTFGVRTGQYSAMVDITMEVQNKVSESGVKNGICMIYIPHTTAGITINENKDQDVIHDFIIELNKVFPQTDSYHSSRGNSLAHIKSSCIGFSESIIIEEGRLLLGTWQSIYFLEFDGPEIRKVYVKIIEG